jgi:hypothetical protein
MAISTLIATGTTEITSSSVIVDAGSTITVGIFTQSGAIAERSCAQLFIKTPNLNTQIGTLNVTTPVLQVQGPGEIIVKRLATPDAIGVFLDSASAGSGGSTFDGLTNAELRATPVSTTDTKNGTREYDFAGNVRQTVTSTSTAAVTLPTLYASREVMVHAAERCVIRFGGSDVPAATVASGQLILEAGERFHFRVAAGVTHFRAIRDTVDGFVSITAVVL